MWKCRCGEVNPDSSSFCQSCGNNKPTSEIVAERARQKEIIEKEKRAREQWQRQHRIKIDNLGKMGLNGYYEYKVINLSDSSYGGVYLNEMERILNTLGLDGWHLICAYTNELGRNSFSGGFGGFVAGSNSTVDQNILIFERFVKTSDS